MTKYEGFDHANPDYDIVFRLRAARLKKIRETPGMLAGVLEHYASGSQGAVDFINDWGMTVDPRNAEIGLPVNIPFVLFPKQEEWIHWVYGQWKAREDGLTDKSRDMGVSWLAMSFATWMWRFHAGVVAGFGSRKEEYVDKIGDPKSLFWKGRAYIRLLPKEFRPAGYEESKHAPHMRIINPENGAVIVGEAGDNIGRGNRTGIYFKDESAFYERPQAIDAALSQTSNCKIDISTPNGNGNPFYQKRHSWPAKKIFTLHWRDNPMKDEAWYNKQIESLDPVIVAQEIDINYNASVTNAFFDGALIDECMRRGPADAQAIGKWVIGVDAAHFGDDESIIHSRRGRLNLPQKAFRKLDGPQLAGTVEEHCRDLVAVGGEIGAIVIELDGPGVSCFDQLKLGPFKDKVVGIHTGIRLSDGRNYNIKARLHRRAKEYIETEQPSIAVNADFRAQVSSIKYFYRDGLLLMQAKTEYKKEFGRSPDRNDAFVLTFVDYDEGPAPQPQDETHGYHRGPGRWMK